MRRDIVTGRNYTSKLVRPAQCSADCVHRMMRVVQCLFQCTNKSDCESRIIDEIYGWFARTIDRLISIALTYLSITFKITFRDSLYYLILFHEFRLYNRLNVLQLFFKLIK